MSTTAEACGGCFHPPPNVNETPSLVVDHRMAFSISKTQTILWDQVRYAGNPKEFAWVLPVRAGTDVEVGQDAFLDVLDGVTAPTIAPPVVQCYYPPIDRSSSGGGGFGCGASDSASFAPQNGGALDAGINAPKDGGIIVVSEKVVGPYETVILRSVDGASISDWLTAHSFIIPSSIVPIIAYYTNLGFDFVAIRLRPDVGTRAMQPIRVVSPGADGTLPLRMVSAGIGATVGLELFVLSEGRYEATSFDNALVDGKLVKWNGASSRSTYAETFDALAASNGKGVWITEHAGKSAVGTLTSRYSAACRNQPPVAIPCNTTDAGTGDGGSDAGQDAGDAGGCVQYVPACDVYDDLTRATDGMNPSDVTITRMRTNLGATALSTDLVVGAAKSQAPVSSFIQTTEFTDPTYNPCPGGSTTPYPQTDPGDGCTTSGNGNSTAVVGLGLVALVALARRRRR